jgi:hypothetical protein
MTRFALIKRLIKFDEEAFRPSLHKDGFVLVAATVSTQLHNDVSQLSACILVGKCKIH